MTSIATSCSDKAQAALAVYGQNGLSEVKQSAYKNYMFPRLYSLRQVSRYCAAHILDPDANRRAIARSAIATRKSVRYCGACGRHGRFVVRFGVCQRCSPTHTPELRRGILTKHFGVPQSVATNLPWRFSRLCRVTPAHVVWRYICSMESIDRRVKRRIRGVTKWNHETRLKWVDAGEDAFYAYIYSRFLAHGRSKVL